MWKYGRMEFTRRSLEEARRRESAEAASSPGLMNSFDAVFSEKAVPLCIRTGCRRGTNEKNICK